MFRKFAKIFTFYFAVRVFIAVVGTLSFHDATATRTSKKIGARFNKPNNNFVRASHFFVHFFAVFAPLRRPLAFCGEHKQVTTKFYFSF